ncbi:MAG: hypothetical protein NUV46_02770 [Nanoarchaeota archaeon]|nr:hypothetical protein [Nanoarchaeota archaeon]
MRKKSQRIIKLEKKRREKKRRIKLGLPKPPKTPKSPFYFYDLSYKALEHNLVFVELYDLDKEYNNLPEDNVQVVKMCKDRYGAEYGFIFGEKSNFEPLFNRLIPIQIKSWNRKETYDNSDSYFSIVKYSQLDKTFESNLLNEFLNYENRTAVFYRLPSGLDLKEILENSGYNSKEFNQVNKKTFEEIIGEYYNESI